MSINANIALDYGDFKLDVELQLPAVGISVIFGPSGSGKTSLLRCIAGLDKPRHASISFASHQWQNDTLFIPSHKRSLAYVFQEPSLFEHLSVLKNLQFAIKRAHQAVLPHELTNITQLLGIDHLLSRQANNLSGGEKQRVAIARALLNKPALLLMDEPLSSLDDAKKLEIMPYFERLKSTFKIPIIYVTHSANEVARLADYLIVLDKGKVLASGSAQKMLSRLDFPIPMGEDTSTIINATIAEHDTQWQLMRVSFSGGELWLKDNGQTLGEPLRLRIFARDISLALSHNTNTSIVNNLPATVLALGDDQHPSTALVQLSIGGSTTLIARLTRRSVHHLGVAVGQSIWVQIKSAAVVQ